MHLKMSSDTLKWSLYQWCTESKFFGSNFSPAFAEHTPEHL